MRICFSLTNLERGGAQMFVLRLAEQVAKDQGHQVWIYDHWPEYRQLSVSPGSSVQLASFSEASWMHWLIWKVNAVLKYSGMIKDLRHRLNRHAFLKFLQRNKIEIVNSHALFSDQVISAVRLPETCAYVPTLHGEYELLLEKIDPEEKKSVITLLKTSRAIIYTAQKNLDYIQGLVSVRIPRYRINVGIEPKDIKVKAISRSEAGIAEQQFVIGMVSRGIPEKGWELAIRIVQRINQQKNPPVKLFMVGDGEYLKRLVLSANDPNIQLAPALQDQNAYYAYYPLFDLFLFPSTFKGESMPNAVIEAISQGIPVLAIEHAELPYMLGEHTGDPCGITVPLSPDLEQHMMAQLNLLIGDKNLLSRLASNCRLAFPKFSLRTISENYLEVFTGNR